MSYFPPFLAGLAAALAAPAPEPAPAAPPAATAAPQGDREAVWRKLAEGFAPRAAAQVRIEQHIMWRITPMPGPARESLTAAAPSAPNPPPLVERKMSECVPMSAIAGGQPQRGSRLLLFLRDRRLVAADLEKSCSARDFYSGFYVDAPNADGRLCADRDRILARNGARCEIARFRLLVPGG